MQGIKACDCWALNGVSLPNGFSITFTLRGTRHGYQLTIRRCGGRTSQPAARDQQAEHEQPACDLPWTVAVQTLRAASGPGPAFVSAPISIRASDPQLTHQAAELSSA